MWICNLTLASLGLCRFLLRKILYLWLCWGRSFNQPRKRNKVSVRVQETPHDDSNKPMPTSLPVVGTQDTDVVNRPIVRWCTYYASQHDGMRDTYACLCYLKETHVVLVQPMTCFAARLCEHRAWLAFMRWEFFPQSFLSQAWPGILLYWSQILRHSSLHLVCPNL